ncbi:MAG TPA: DNA polymerase IV [Cyclobacteriaceae bacterium]
MLFSHPDRAIIHMDLDTFFVSVERLRNSELNGKPLVIGGHSRRGVVASCSYEARAFGIHSAMPIGLAKQLCPDVLIISGDLEAYSKYSSIITEIIREESPLFEKASIDEFYIDITGMDTFYNSYQWGTELRQKIIRETGLPISMGLSVNKLVSKVATNECKPNGQSHIQKGLEREFLAPLAIQKIPMIGDKTTQFLTHMGIRTVRTLREMPLKILQSTFGKIGISLWKKANAMDDAPVVAYSDRKSISTECTFESDTIDVKKLKTIIMAMVEKLAYKLREEKKLTACIAVKIRYSNFDTVSKQRHLPFTSSDQALIRVAMELFDQLYSRRLLIRLVGVRLSNLVYGNYQINLFDDTEEEIRLYQAMDRLKLKYGPDTIFRAATQNVNHRIRLDSNLFKG